MHGLSLAVCLIGACCARVPGAGAQTAAPALEPEGNFRLLNATEGRSIVNAALEQDQPMRGTHDCSHMVHQIYLVAGFEYPYVSSFDIYAGGENFERVKIAQPGDLIVWPGHVGIVLDPVQHSFYSLVRTGLETQYYDGPYWKGRGRPRFYRYKVQGQEILTAAKTPAPPRASKATSQRVEPSVSEEQPAAGISDPNRPPRAVSERTPVNYGPKAPEEAEAPVTGVEVPQSIILAAGNKQPTRDEVAEGISELSNAAGNVLRANDPSKLQTPVVIFERLSVERLEIKRNHGWARLQLETRVSLAGGRTDTRRRHEKVARKGSLGAAPNGIGLGSGKALESNVRAAGRGGEESGGAARALDRKRRRRGAPRNRPPAGVSTREFAEHSSGELVDPALSRPAIEELR